MAMHVHDRFAVDVVPNAPPHDHAVDVYADEFAIIRELIRFVEDGLALGETVVVVANRPHRASLAAWCTDHLSVGDTESLLLIDAAETLQKFLVAGSPDPSRRSRRQSARLSIVLHATAERSGCSARWWRFCGRTAILRALLHSSLCGTTWHRIGGSSCCVPTLRHRLTRRRSKPSTRCDVLRVHFREDVVAVWPVKSIKRFYTGL